MTPRDRADQIRDLATVLRVARLGRVRGPERWTRRDVQAAQRTADAWAPMFGVPA